ncbi:MAG TPA: GNAT family N-acetyltransferase [Pirellulales bacterium]|jgi:hypothetical protein|nr:GNAT family N-acetyltransferase [Pirellulales bacterium]
MHAIRHASPEGLLAHAGELLLQAEAEHNLILGICGRQSPEQQAAAATAWWLTIEDRGAIAGVAVMTPPHHLVISRLSDSAVECLANDLLTAEAPIPGVAGPSTSATRFAETWSRLTHQNRSLQMDQRIYACQQVQPVLAASGQIRLAQPGDGELLAAWSREFEIEIGNKTASDSRLDFVNRLIAKASVFVWDDGRPVSCAAFARETENGVAVNFVYTPRELRGHGYATSCVAALTARLLGSGKTFCCLYADLANPTSNGIYQRIGYRPVCESQAWKFGD